MIDKIEKLTQKKMKNSIEHFERKLKEIHAGKVSSRLIENIKIKCYGSNIPLIQISNIYIENSSSLIINAFDKTINSLIKKSIVSLNINVSLSMTDNKIRVTFPKITEDRRKELIKLIQKISEKEKIRIRNIRRHSNETIRSLLKNKKINQDEERKSQSSIQKLTELFIKKVDKILNNKENELKIF
ncbi:hypothetical protein AOQ88_01265 [Candidatus Riesia sp. GBBU]|nr:hypothetical protein AOQ88_01265 [Candidatus Riesia sp. GBBU]